MPNRTPNQSSPCLPKKGQLIVPRGSDEAVDEQPIPGISRDHAGGDVAHFARAFRRGRLYFPVDESSCARYGDHQNAPTSGDFT